MHTLTRQNSVNKNICMYVCVCIKIKVHMLTLIFSLFILLSDKSIPEIVLQGVSYFGISIIKCQMNTLSSKAVWQILNVVHSVNMLICTSPTKHS